MLEALFLFAIIALAVWVGTALARRSQEKREAQSYAHHRQQIAKEQDRQARQAAGDDWVIAITEGSNGRVTEQYNDGTERTFSQEGYDRKMDRETLERITPSVEERLKTLEVLHADGYIADEEYQRRRAAILDEI